MTRNEALTALLAKVKAGEQLSGNTAFWADAETAFSINTRNIGNMVKAYHGSLDAAKALHEAVLSGCSQYSIVTDPTCLCVKICWWPDGFSVGRKIHGIGWSEGNEGRAWLIAILEALITMEEDQ